MYRLIFAIIISGMATFNNAQKLQLSQPNSNIVMAMVSKKNPQMLAFDFRMEGAEIRYTQDGSEPTLQSKRYRKPIQINQPCIIQAKVFHRDFNASETVIATFISGGNSIHSYQVSEPNLKYRAEGAKSLFDSKFGDMSYTKNYLGYDKGPIEIVIKPNSDQDISELHLSYLIHQGAWIFEPSLITIYEEQGQKLAVLKLENSSVKRTSGHQITTISIPKNQYKVLKIVVSPVSQLPDWHDGRGLTAWVFIDEVWIN
jgi:hypothetical protein